MSKERPSNGTDWIRAPLFIGALAATGLGTQAMQSDPLVRALHEPAAAEMHADQLTLLDHVRRGETEEAFEMAFEMGDELFEVTFNSLDGGGARVGEGQRFTRTPRADLAGRGEWANHFPSRETGPNAESCASCHRVPADDGSGLSVDNVHRDPLHSGRNSAYVHRNTPHLFAMGALQRLAEETTLELHRIRDEAAAEAARTRRDVTRELEVQGIEFGSIVALARGGFDTSRVSGVKSDLVVRPYQWKGSVAFLRDFNRGAAHNEIGMQPVELVGERIDGDGDGVTDEMSVGDQTAMAIYLAAQPRPTTLLELSRLGLLDPPLTRDERNEIRAGAALLREIGCTDCHVPRLQLADPVFCEPSELPDYRDKLFPAGQDPLALGLDPLLPVSFDLTSHQPDNRVHLPSGAIYALGSLRKDDRGRALVELFGDLRRHDMGRGLAESIDEVGSGASTFLTENLWGVGSTAPYLHDGRASTLTEAILEHGGEAKRSREKFLGLELEEQRSLIAFLGNLVLCKLEEPEAFRGGGRRLKAPALASR